MFVLFRRYSDERAEGDGYLTSSVAASGEGTYLVREDCSVDGQLVRLMDRYELPLFKFLFVLVGSREVAQDCCQDTFVRAYDNLRKGKPVTSQWLYKVARNRAMDEFRRGRREQRDLAELELIPADGLDVPERRAAMREAFTQLSPDERAVLYLFSVQGMSGAEISALLGITVGAVRMRIARAREHFRQAYGGAA